MPNVYIVATARVRAEKRDAFMGAAKACIEATRIEPGCLRYDMHESVTEPNLFVFVEEWISHAAIDAHFAAPHTGAFLSLAGECVAAPPVIEIIAPASVEWR